MPVFRVEKHCEFTAIANYVFKDKSLSAKAKGLLVEILSLPDNWDYTLKVLTSLFADGIDSIRKGILELEEHGYIVRERKRDSKGQLGRMEYVIYETPHKAENMPVSDSPALENPTLDEPTEELSMTYKELKNKEYNKSITNQSIYQEKSEMEVIDVMGYEEARYWIETNIEYDILCERYPQERLDEIVDIAVEALYTRRSTFNFGNEVYPYSLVRDRLLKLDASHIEYIFTCMDSNTTEIHNIKQYLLKTLINAPTTVEAYYTTKVHHDLYGGQK